MAAPELQQEERAPVVGEEISGARPLPEAPPEAVDLTDEVREGWDEMPSEAREFSRSLFGRLKEKLASTEVVQNIADRVSIWRDRRMAERVQNNVDKIATAQGKDEKLQAELRERAARMTGELAEVAPLLKDLGIELGTAERHKVIEESAGVEAEADAVSARIEQASGRIVDLVGKKDAFEARVDGARGRLDGRLAEKQEINNQSLEKFRGNVMEIDSGLSEKRAEAKDLDRKMIELRGAMKGIKSEIVRGLLGGKIAGLESERAQLDLAIKQMEKEKAKHEAQIQKFEAKNADLKKRRDQIYPKKSPEANAPVEARVPAIDASIGFHPIEDVMTASADYGDGSRKELAADGRVFYFNPDESESSRTGSTDDLSDDEFEEFFSGGETDAQLKAWRFSEKILDRIEKIREGKKMTAAEITGGWNRFAEHRLGSKHGLSVKAEGDPGRAFTSRDAAKQYLLELIAKKVAKDKTTKSLSRRATGLVAEYFDSRNR